MTLWPLVALSLYCAIAAQAHGEHHGKQEGETIQQYAKRHMATEHHIDDFDLRSFFHLHDLDRSGFWDRAEIEAIYGVHHVYSQKKSKDEEEHQKKADYIVSEVLKILDKSNDGRVTPEELEAVGLDGLPNFEELGAEGHHYDVESEFFLHHEEQYHSTPETQTDESYTHPEDYEHFGHHEEIERKEAEKEAKYQGVSVEEVIKVHEEAEAAADEAAARRVAEEAAQAQEPLRVVADHPHGEQVEAQTPVQDSSKPQYTREVPPEKQDPSVRFREAKEAADKKGEWGQGAGGYRAPKEPSDRLRKNLPYKYKFKKNWGDF